MLDECGYFFTVEKDGEEYVVSRIYCRFELAASEFEGIIEEYRDKADVVRMYGKLANLIDERVLKR